MSLKTKLYNALDIATKDEIDTAYRRGIKKGFRDYAGAQINRLTSDWVSSTTSIQNDIRGSFIILRERARDLAKNNHMMKRWLHLCKANIIGPNGFTFQSNVTEFVEDPATKTVKRVSDKRANDKIEEAFRDWSLPANCSVNGRLSFRQICNQVIEYKKRDGEAFIWKLRNKSKYGFQLHILAPEALDEQKTELLPNGNKVFMGIELDSWNRPVNYYFKKSDPHLEIYGMTSYTREHTIVPASQIIHFFQQEYENQTRGVTEATQAMLLLKHLHGYDESVVVNARATAAKGMYLESDPNNPDNYKGDDEDASGNIISSMEPGAVEQLPAGMKAHLLDPTYPSDQYGPYQRAMGLKLSAGLNVAYASLTNDLSDANYGSNRVGLLDERCQWQIEQQDFIDSVLLNIFPAWLEMALLKVIDLPFEKFEKFNKPVWTGRRWDWIDPLKDATAKIMELRTGQISPYKLAAERGEDPEEILDDLAAFYAMAKAKGVPLNLDGITINIDNSQENKPKGKDQDNERLELIPLNGNGKH